MRPVQLTATFLEMTVGRKTDDDYDGTEQFPEQFIRLRSGLGCSCGHKSAKRSYSLWLAMLSTAFLSRFLLRWLHRRLACWSIPRGWHRRVSGIHVQASFQLFAPFLLGCNDSALLLNPRAQRLNQSLRSASHLIQQFRRNLRHPGHKRSIANLPFSPKTSFRTVNGHCDSVQEVALLYRTRIQLVSSL